MGRDFIWLIMREKNIYQKTGKDFILYSKNSMIEESESNGNLYKTGFKIESLENVTRAKLFIRYKRNEYEAQNAMIQ